MLQSSASLPLLLGKGKWQRLVLLEEIGLEICHKSIGGELGVREAHVHEPLKCQENQPIISSERKMYKLPTMS
jgi:hypothetical protein